MNGMNGSGMPTVSAVSPEHVFLARTVDVEISGSGTNWSKTTKVDFGMGITVNSVNAASGAGLIANITIDQAAPTGPHDVIVTDGSKSEVFGGGLSVDPPAVATQVKGTQAQGSIVLLHVADRDIANPFDTTQTQGNFVNFAAQAGMTDLGVNNVTDFGADLVDTIDVTQMAGAQDVSIVSGPPKDMMNDVLFPLPKAVTVAARMPTPLGGTPAMGNIKNALDSDLYSFTPMTAAVAILDWSATSMQMAANPKFAIMPKSGKFADLFMFTSAYTVVSAATDPFYAVYWDNSGTTGAYSLGVKSVAPAASAPSNGNNGTMGTAQAAAGLPFVLTGAKLANAMSEVWVKVTTTAMMVSNMNVFNVQTVPGDPATDTSIDVFEADGMTALGQISGLGGLADGVDNFGPRNLVTPPIDNAGTFFVHVHAGANYDPKHTDFQLVIRVQ